MDTAREVLKNYSKRGPPSALLSNQLRSVNPVHFSSDNVFSSLSSSAVHTRQFLSHCLKWIILYSFHVCVIFLSAVVSDTCHCPGYFLNFMSFFTNILSVLLSPPFNPHPFSLSLSLCLYFLCLSRLFSFLDSCLTTSRLLNWTCEYFVIPCIYYYNSCSTLLDKMWPKKRVLWRSCSSVLLLWCLSFMFLILCRIFFWTSDHYSGPIYWRNSL